jgi:VanZ family protein
MKRWPSLLNGTKWLLPVVWMLLIFAFSSQPTLPQAPSPLVDLLLKKGGHMAGYAVLLVLWWRAWRTRSPTWLALIISWLLTLSYAVLDEYHQTFVPGRHGRIEDVLIDTGGMLLATCSIWLSTWHNARRPSARDY